MSSSLEPAPPARDLGLLGAFSIGIGGIVVEQLLKLAISTGLAKLKKQLEAAA